MLYHCADALTCNLTACGLWMENDTPWLYNIAMENGPFIDGLPITNGDFPWLC